ncbi:putative polysaccharide biosynthesis protein [Oceanobacillus manasiensis]|uniref:putative polysaccharide biosynthesis protein n=1 Tax=Oceanobacillus manasiensis TaxID=586413 RepID=UPI0005AB31F1|nr:polysaccharide biosynthesis protein [Oceanobacillus manasiensis]
MSKNETNQLLKGALLLTAAGILSKLLSAGYRIPLQNLTGDIGYYVYQQIYPILGIIMVLSLYGFPAAISKIRSEIGSKAGGQTIRNFYFPLLLILFILNGAMFLFLFINAPNLARWIGDPELTSTYRITAIVFLFVPFLALLRGSFQGEQKMAPTAISQVSEQIIRVSLLITAAIVISSNQLVIYQVGHTAAIASIIGAVAGTIVLIVFFLRDRPNILVEESTEIPWNYYVRTMLLFGAVAALNHMVLLVIQFADTFTLLPGLIESGLAKQEAMEAKGVFDRGQPLIQLGTVLGSSFALALLPNISQDRLKQQPALFYQYIRGGLLFSIYLAFGATIGLILIFREANILLFQNDLGTGNLRLLVVSILLCSISITAASILQGLGHVKRTASFILGAFFIKWIANQLLVPIFGITGSAVATVLSLLLLCAVTFYELQRKLPKLKFMKVVNVRALGMAIGVMVLYVLIMHAWLADYVQPSRFLLLLYVVFIALTGGGVYLFCLLRFRAFSRNEVSMLPFSSYILRFYKGRLDNESN